MGSDGEHDTRPGADHQVSHAISDLINPLTTIHGYAQLLQRRIHARGVPDSEELLASLAKIKAASRTIEMRLRQLDEETPAKKT